MRPTKQQSGYQSNPFEKKSLKAQQLKTRIQEVKANIQ